MARRFVADPDLRVGFWGQLQPEFDWSWADDGPSWVSPSVDSWRPSIARWYDFALGGKDNYEIDRALGLQVLEVAPDATAVAQANRAFVLRAVQLMARTGIRQFLDLGCGIPTGATVHEAARQVAPDARVAYIDHDPTVLAHMRSVLDGQRGLYAGLHDLRDPARVLADPGVRDVIRFDEPVGVVLGAVLHFVDASLGVQVVGHYASKIPTGSHVAVSMAGAEGMSPDLLRSLTALLEPVTGPVVFRTKAQVEELLEGLELLPPGIVDVTRWHADDVPGSVRLHAAVAVKPPRKAR